MLDAIRRGAVGWFAKGLLFLLILSLVVWGVADVFRGYGAGSLAKVGSAEISTEDFRRSYQLQLEEIRRRFGNRISADQARALGLEQQVLSRLIGAAAVDVHAGELELALSEDKLVDLVRADPNFQGVDGKFSRIALDGFLRQAGLSERGYMALRRKDEVRDQLTEAILQSIAPPQAMVELLHKYREETRSITHFTIDPIKVKVAEPDDAKLKEAYEGNKRQFVVPEYRKLALLTLNRDDARAQITVSDSDIQAAYEREKDIHSIPERRRLQQIAFKDRASAEAAKAEIVKGRSFADVAKDAGAKDSDIELGKKTRRELIDKKIADAAFSLAKDAVSDVVEGQFATVLLRATEIEAGRQKPIDEVQAEIRDRLTAEPTRELIQKLHDQVDDLRAAAKSLKDISETLKIKFVEVGETDKFGKKSDGGSAIVGADAEKIAAAAFDGKTGVEAESIELTDGGYAWFDILAVTPERQKPFEDVTADVKTLWFDLERRRAVTALGATLAERAHKGEAIETLAAEAGGTIETTKSFKRTGAQPSLPETAVSQAFILGKGRLTSAETRDGNSRIVIRLDEITPAPPLTPEAADRARGELARQMQQDVIAEYLEALQQRIGVTINQAELQRATGADAGAGQ